MGPLRYFAKITSFLTFGTSSLTFPDSIVVVQEHDHVGKFLDVSAVARSLMTGASHLARFHAAVQLNNNMIGKSSSPDFVAQFADDIATTKAQFLFNSGLNQLQIVDDQARLVNAFTFLALALISFTVRPRLSITLLWEIRTDR